MSTWTKTLAAGLLAATATFAPLPAQAQPYGSAERTVAGWYRQFLRRPMDAGAQQWIDMLRGGEDPRVVEAGILGSQEYWQMSSQNPGRFVDHLYRDVTGQRPSRRDVDYWAGRVANGEDRQDVALDFLSQYER